MSTQTPGEGTSVMHVVVPCAARRGGHRSASSNGEGLWEQRSVLDRSAPRTRVTRQKYKDCTGIIVPKKIIEPNVFTHLPLEQNGGVHADVNWGLMCQKQVSRTETGNYMPQYLWDMIIYPCLWYQILSHKSSISSASSLMKASPFDRTSVEYFPIEACWC